MENKGENMENKGENQDKIFEYGQEILQNNKKEYTIHLISVIGEIEGHDCLPATSKTTKYEHVLPQLAEIEENKDIDGLLLILNTVGGDVESGLAIAEMVASLSKPSVSLVLGGSHSIGIPLAVSTNYSMIVPSGTMVIHPVRMSGTVIGAPATFDYFQQMQDRIIGFIEKHSKASEDRLVELMMNTQMLTKDLGTILVGEQAVKEGLIDSIGGISEAFNKLYELIETNKEKY
ncbi:MAG: ATP-dependent Clp protease proteolytic subunit [Agathobacter sp.]|nr:ATP-dependent Clp protease proteolytic subunit [Agathobacter sp.]